MKPGVALGSEEMVLPYLSILLRDLQGSGGYGFSEEDGG